MSCRNLPISVKSALDSNQYFLRSGIQQIVGGSTLISGAMLQA